MANILGIGIATLDIINTVEQYPAEDNEVRALAQRITRGGNVTNTLVVLSQSGHQCAWGGVLGTGAESIMIEDDLNRHAIDVSGCRRVDQGRPPLSCITINASNGSRTIIHYRDLPEFTFEDFNGIDLMKYNWIHFEGRNIEETERMLQHVKSFKNIPVSLEVEKPRAGIETLFSYADVLIFSRAYAIHCGYDEAKAFLVHMRTLAANADLVCAWGDQGAYGLDTRGKECFSPAFVQDKVVDTIGAGDTLNAGIIHGIMAGDDLQHALESACHLAGKKCGQVGFDGLLIK
jgi:ketohexokinase